MAVAADAASPVAQMCQTRRLVRLASTERNLWNTLSGANAKSGVKLATTDPQSANPIASLSVESMANEAAWEASIGKNFMLPVSALD